MDQKLIKTTELAERANLAPAIMEYMLLKGYRLKTGKGLYNIVYVEGMNPDGTLNNDRLDGWNDLRLLIEVEGDFPRVKMCAIATTEPGRSATFSTAARRRGGVARVQLTQYEECWKIGFHKRESSHLALVQCKELKVFRDANRDGIRPGDRLSFAWGINQHGTAEYLRPSSVGNWSEGCLVGLNWGSHLYFMYALIEGYKLVWDSNTREYRTADGEIGLFDTTIIGGNDPLFKKCLKDAQKVV